MIAPSDVDPIRPATFTPRADPDRGSPVSTVKRCAYRRWLPELADTCQCWLCTARREPAPGAQDCRGCGRAPAGARGGLCDGCSERRSRELTRTWKLEKRQQREQAA